MSETTPNIANRTQIQRLIDERNDAETKLGEGILSPELSREARNVFGKVPGMTSVGNNRTVGDILDHVKVMSQTMQRLFDQVEQLRREKARTDDMLESAGELFLRMTEAAHANRARVSGDHH